MVEDTAVQVEQEGAKVLLIWWYNCISTNGIYVVGHDLICQEACKNGTMREKIYGYTCYCASRAPQHEIVDTRLLVSMACSLERGGIMPNPMLFPDPAREQTRYDVRSLDIMRLVSSFVSLVRFV